MLYPFASGTLSKRDRNERPVRILRPFSAVLGISRPTRKAIRLSSQTRLHVMQTLSLHQREENDLLTVAAIPGTHPIRVCAALVLAEM